MIGAVPPLAFADWRYVITAVLASIAIFWLQLQLTRPRRRPSRSWPSGYA